MNETTNESPCPCCGYCRHCGRRNAAPQYVPWYPYQPTITPVPWYPYPWWGTAPPIVNVPSVWITNNVGDSPQWTFTTGGDA